MHNEFEIKLDDFYKNLSLYKTDTAKHVKNLSRQISYEF